MELDHSGAHSLAIRYCDEHGLDHLLDLMTPPIVMLVMISDHGNINERNPEPVVEITHQLVVGLGDRFGRRGPLRADELLASEVHNLGAADGVGVVTAEGWSRNLCRRKPVRAGNA